MDNYIFYTTIQNDTFDIIALDFWDDESKAPLIIAANQDYKNVIVFDAGITLKIPLIDTNQVADTLPPWKR